VIVLYLIFIALFAFVLGGLNGAIITSKLAYGDDIRKHGSGNAGLTNFYRTYGGQGAFLVVLIDVIKTALPVILGGNLLADHFAFANVEERILLGRTFAGLFAVIGHAYPCFNDFKGGKGILAAGTMILFLDYRVFLIVAVVFFSVVALTRYVSLASVLTALAFPIAMLVLGMPFWATILAALCATFVIYRHRENLQRLVKGEERKLSIGKKPEQAEQPEQTEEESS